MENVFSNCGNIFQVSVLVYLIALVAMSVDLACGIRKAKSGVSTLTALRLAGVLPSS